MRIAHLLLTSRFAGSERHALELAAHQASHGHEVHLILRRAGAASRPDAIAHRVDPAVRTHQVPDWLPAWHARRLLHRLRPDVAHAHLSGGCRALRSLEGRIPVRTATLHIAFKRRQHAHLDGLVAIAPWQLAAIPAPLRARSTQVDNWTLPNPPAADARARLRQAHGIAPEARVFGALGRVEDSKGLDVLVEAFRRAALPGARLVIVGRGKAWQRLRAQAPPEVLMPGFAERPQDWLAAFDVFCSAARSEPFGLVLLEAMQAGLPIVASATEGARHLATAIARPLVPINDAESLAAALTEALDAPRRDGEKVVAPWRIGPKADAIEAHYRALGAAG